MSDCAIEAGSDEVITDDELYAPISAQEVDEAIRSLKGGCRWDSERNA